MAATILAVSTTIKKKNEEKKQTGREVGVPFDTEQTGQNFR